MPFNDLRCRGIIGVRWILVTALVAASTALAAPDEKAADDAAPAATLPADPNGRHLTRQAGIALDQVDAMLAKHPPSAVVSPERAMTLTLLDAILQDPNITQRPAVREFWKARTEHAVAEMQRTRIDDGRVIVWHLYNMGFVVRSRSATVAFDLVKLRHVPELSLDDETMQAVVDQCDAMFVSHAHLDHADPDVAAMFVKAGKPVLAPQEVWQGQPIHSQLPHPTRDGEAQPHPLKLSNGSALNVAIYPGFQMGKPGAAKSATAENNVYLITLPDGQRIAHTGDNTVEAGLPKPGTSVDILLMKMDPGGLKTKQIVDRFSPRLVLPSHFEELGHVNPASRQPYWLGLDRAARLSVPTVIMTWGEAYQLERW